MAFYGILISSILLCVLGFCSILSQNSGLQGSLVGSYALLSANIRLAYTGEIISDSGTGNYSMQNNAQSNGVNLTCTSDSCTISMPNGYYIINK